MQRTFASTTDQAGAAEAPEGHGSRWSLAAERLFARAGLPVSAASGVASGQRALAEAVVSALADCCIIHLITEGGLVEVVEVAAADAKVGALLREQLLPAHGLPGRDQSIVARVLRTREAVLLQGDDLSGFEPARCDEQDRALLKHIKARSVITVPLLAHGIAIGTITLILCSSRPRYRARAVALAGELARRAARAIDQGRRYRAAEQAIRQRDEALSIVAHDVGNGLTSINLAATLLLEPTSDGTAGPQTQVYAAMIQDRVAVMARLLHDVLDMSRLEAGHMNLRRELHPAGEQVARAVEALRPLAEARSVQMTVLPADALPPVYADGRRLLQALENIIGNAVKFTPPQGQITIRMTYAGEVVQYAVADTGPGIAAEHMPRVFDWFWQATPEHQVGTGLGLAIARRIIEMHGGRLSVESSIGAGATFFFTMPTAADSDA